MNDTKINPMISPKINTAKSWALVVLMLAVLVVPLAIGASSSSASSARSASAEPSQRTQLGRVVEQEPSGQETSRQESVRPRRERAREEHTGRGYLGVQVDDLTRGLRRHFGVEGEVGVLVEDVEADSPAAVAGLVAGDVVVAIDGESVTSARGLTRAIHARPGETVVLEVVRDGRTIELTGTLGDSRRATRARRPRVEADDVGERVAAAFAGVDWEAIGEHGDRFGEELEQRLQQAFDSKDWEEFGKRWEDWGEQQGKHWEEWGERFAEQFENMDWEGFGDQWAEWGEDQGEKWAQWGERFADDFAGNSEQWAELGERIGDSVGSVDWDGLGEMIERIVREVMTAVENLPDHHDHHDRQ